MKIRGKSKIVFIGGNLLGCNCLRYLLRAKNVKILKVVGCYHDNGSVIEPRVWNASLARVALNRNLPFIQPKSTHNLQFINDIQNTDRPDFIFTIGYDKVLDPMILAIPRIGTINIHFSPLPRHRGHFPFVWSLLEDQEAGVTLHWVTEKINAGDIIATEKISIEPDDTAYSLYLKLSKVGLELFKSYFPKIIKGIAPRIRQDESQASYHPAGYPEQRIIDWNKPAKDIDRFIRALTFPEFDSARTYFHDMEISILHPVELMPPVPNFSQQDPGTIVKIGTDGLVVQTGDGAILIKKIRINQSLPIDAYKLARLFDLHVGETFKKVEKLHVSSQLNLIVP